MYSYCEKVDTGLRSVMEKLCDEKSDSATLATWTSFVLAEVNNEEQHQMEHDKGNSGIL